MGLSVPDAAVVVQISNGDKESSPCRTSAMQGERQKRQKAATRVTVVTYLLLNPAMIYHSLLSLCLSTTFPSAISSRAMVTDFTEFVFMSLG